jgi:hypothetical protein
MAPFLTVFLEALPARTRAPDRGGNMELFACLIAPGRPNGAGEVRPRPRRTATPRWNWRRECHQPSGFRRQGASAPARTRPAPAAPAREG